MLHQCKRGTSCSPSWEEWGILEQGSSRLQAVQTNKVKGELIITVSGENYFFSQMNRIQRPYLGQVLAEE